MLRRRSDSAALVLFVVCLALALLLGFTTTAVSAEPDGPSPGLQVSSGPTRGSLEVTPTPPKILLSASSLAFTMTQGGPNPAPKAVNVGNGGQSTLSWSAVDNKTWVWIGSPTGTNSGTFWVNINATGAAPGTYYAMVTVSAPGATSRNIPVTLKIKRKTVATSSLSPTTLAYNGVATMKGALRTSGGTLIPGKTMVLQRSWDNSNWSYYKSVYSATGNYSTGVRVDRKTYFRWRFYGDASNAPSWSAVRVATSKAYLTAPAMPSTVRFYTYYTTSGFLKPGHADGSGSAVKIVVYAWDEDSDSWELEGSASCTISDYNGYSYYESEEFRWTGWGTFKMRARAVHSDSNHLTTYSPWEYFTLD